MECLIHPPSSSIFSCVKMAWVAGLGGADAQRGVDLEAGPVLERIRLVPAAPPVAPELRDLAPVTLFGGGQVPPLLASVPRNPDGPRQIHRFPHFLIADFSLSGQRLLS